jgi:hypothetical protein
MPGDPTLDQMMLPIAPSQGFPDPASVNANSGLAWLAQQPPSAGMSFQDIINTLPQAPDKLLVPAGSLPDGTVYTGDPYNPFININRAQPEPSPEPAVPYDAPSPAPEQHGQADQAPGDVIAADAGATNNGPSAAAPAQVIVTANDTSTTDTGQQPPSDAGQTSGTGGVPDLGVTTMAVNATALPGDGDPAPDAAADPAQAPAQNLAMAAGPAPDTITGKGGGKPG